MSGFFASVTKIAIASLFIGALLNMFDLSAETILAEIGFTPENLIERAKMAFDWALPNFILGSMIVIPVWIVIFLLRPPRRTRIDN